MEVVLEIFGDKQVSRDLLRFSDRVKDLRPVFAVLATDFYRIENEQFDSEGEYGSGGWKPLTPDYLRQKISAGYDARILHRTNALSRSLTRPGARGSVRKITKDTLQLGTKVKNKKGFPYPAVHQNPKRGQTRRRPVELRKSDRVEWIKKIQRWIVTGKL